MSQSAQDTEERADSEAVGRPRMRSLYARHITVHPKAVTGHFRNLKWAAMVALLAVYYIVPWIRWDRGPNAPAQAVLIDFPARKFYFFFIEIWPQEVYYLTGILVMMAIGLFGLTSTFGRVWCGFACPQTVWTDLFVWVERMVIGDRNARQKFESLPMSPQKFAKLIVKHAIWLCIGMATGGAWVFYFADAPTLAVQLTQFQAPAAAYVTIAFLTISTYIMAGWSREQVCTYMCPYARFQAAMLDEHSLIVSYRTDRGEPRGKYKKGTPFEPGKRGDCIDCDSCVTACPTGIDIRDGQQLECINCGLCADACNAVMDVVKRPRGLIGLDSLANLNARLAGQTPKLRLIRPRTLVYLAVWCAVGAIMLVSLSLRSDLKLDVLRDRNPYYVAMADGSIRNGYTFHIINKKHVDRHLALAVDGLPDARISVLNEAAGADLAVGPDTVATYRVWVSAPRTVLKSDNIDIKFILTDPATGKRAVYDGVFTGPSK